MGSWNDDQRTEAKRHETDSLIYLDNNATTREDPLVVEAMVDHLKDAASFGNASSSHSLGTRARRLIDDAREQVRCSINGTHADEIVFTSGGTESNNLAIRGILQSNVDGEDQHVITTPFEHPAVHNVLEHLHNSHRRLQISFVKVDSNGLVDLEDFRRLLNPKTKLVTIMHSNNEIGQFTLLCFPLAFTPSSSGSVQPIQQIIDIVRHYAPSGIVIHSDASQSLGKLPVDVSSLGIDLLTICSHKFHGPKGIGALYVRRGIQLDPILFGGQHERGLRPGTENLLAIIGLAKACQLISNEQLLNTRIEQMRRARDRLYQGLASYWKKSTSLLIVRHGDDCCLPNTLSLSFRGIDAKQLVHQLRNQLAFSTGSACHEDSEHPVSSTTLRAIGNPRSSSHSTNIFLFEGLSKELSRGTVRLTTSYMTTDDQIDRATALLSNAIEEQLSVAASTNGHR